LAHLPAYGNSQLEIPSRASDAPPGAVVVTTNLGDLNPLTSAIGEGRTARGLPK
jgi:hypothetical protein